MIIRIFFLERKRKAKKGTRVKDVEKMAQEQESQLKTLTELMESTYDRYLTHLSLLMLVSLSIDSEMLIIVFEQNVFMNLACGCKNYHKYTLTVLIFDTWAGHSLIL